MKAVYIIDAVRTPIGKYGGGLKDVRPDDLAAHAIKALMARNPKVDWALIEDVVLGAANQAGEDNRNVARMALLLAGLPTSSGGVTVNRLCASGLQAIMDSTRAILNNDGELYIAGGVESMSRAPLVMGKADSAFDRKQQFFDTTMGWRFINDQLSALYQPYSMGETAENVAKKWGVSRSDQDAFAFASQQKYQWAHQKGAFKDELIAVEIPQRKDIPIIFDKDEHPRLSSIEQLGKLKPAFLKDGTVTAGNSSGINDGAAGLLLASADYIKRNNINPLARVASMAVAGVDPAYMGIGPVPATKKALMRAGIQLKDLDLVELNEAFASQSLACMKDLNIDPNLVNVNGGAIALGHPLGCSGARISATLIHEMKRRTNAQYGLATMCIGVGQGAAIVYEKC